MPAAPWWLHARRQASNLSSGSFLCGSLLTLVLSVHPMCVCALPHLHSHGSQLFPPHSSQLHHRPVIGFCMDPYIYSPSPGEAHQHLPPTVLWGPHCGSCNLLCNLLHRNYMLSKPTYFKLYSWFTRSLPACGLSSKANVDRMWAGKTVPPFG